MFSKILIANRGEIACRVMDTCARLGVATVAVHSDADALARHVALADEAVPLGGNTPADSYLRGDAIIAAAQATGAQAIHPGYGFLSENPDFVDAVQAAGLVFIGPSADAIRAMGLKDAAKALMAQAGVPVVPGYHGPNQDDAHLESEAKNIGYPVLIKAVAGGGGKGMRLVADPKGFAEGLAGARAEAKAAFGNADVLIEKFVDCPRHIEVQVFGDGVRAVHLFERDCSLQRRHQKVIEEAPAPGMTDAVRSAMGAAAVRAAEAIGYKGAGTIEFIVDGSGPLREDGFWFMEMNTRLQVEHPVTEAITGVDLVEWQLRVASGEDLPLAQEALSIRGHAFEARLYAEDVAAGFLPATGRLTHLAFSPLARADTGVRAGDTITPYYDPMIAKVIVHGSDRAAALNRLTAALDGTEVAGCVTNLAFLGALTRHPGFAAGDVDTGLIGRDLADLTHVPETPVSVLAIAAVTALGLPGPALEGFALWQPQSWAVALTSAGDTLVQSVTVIGRGAYKVVSGSAEVAVAHAGNAWRVGGAKHAVRSLRNGRNVSVFADQTWSFEIEDPLARGSDDAAAADVVVAPMPGAVRGVFAKVGQAVAAGDRLAILEAMKMEHTLRAGRDGVVAEVMVAEGDQVEAGAALVRLEDSA